MWLVVAVYTGARTPRSTPCFGKMSTGDRAASSSAAPRPLARTARSRAVLADRPSPHLRFVDGQSGRVGERDREAARPRLVENVGPSLRPARTGIHAPRNSVTLVRVYYSGPRIFSEHTRLRRRFPSLPR